MHDSPVWQAKFAEAQRISRVGSWEWDVAQDRVSWSDELFRIFGFEPGEYEPSYESFLERVHPDDREYIREHIEASFIKRKPYVVEHRIIMPDGSVRHLHGEGEVLCDEHNNPQRLIGTAQDITDRKRAEDLMQIQRDLGILLSEASDLNEVLDHLLEASLRIEEIDCGGIYIFDSSSGALRLQAHRGLSSRFVANVSVYESDTLQVRLVLGGEPVYGTFKDVSPGYNPECDAEGLGALALLPVKFKGRVVASLNLASHTCAALSGSSQRALEAIAARVGGAIARVRMEAALRDSEQRLSNLLDNLPGMAYRCLNDRDWTMQVMSSGCLELTGYPPEDLIENNRLAYNDLIHADDRESVWSGVQAALREDRSFLLSYRIQTASGEVKWVWEQGRYIRSAAGELLALEGIIIDATAQKLVEKSLRRRVELEDRLAELIDRLSRAEGENVQCEIVSALGAAGEAMGVDRAYLYRIDEAASSAVLTAHWRASWLEERGTGSLGLDFDAFPALAKKLAAGQGVVVPRVADLPVEAGAERAVLEAARIISLIILPLWNRGTLIGYLGFDALRSDRAWVTECHSLLRILVYALGDVLERHVAHVKAREANRGAP